MNKKMIIILPIVLIVIVAAFILFTNEGNKEKIEKEAPIALDEQSCDELSGVWVSQPSHNTGCFGASDFGKECKDDEDCQGNCLVDDANEFEKKNKTKPVIGKCSEEGCVDIENPLANSAYCSIPTTDSGKECLDGSECEGSCIGEGEPNWIKPEGKTKKNEPYPLSIDQSSAPLIGKCSDMTVALGCQFYMENGIALYQCRD